MAEHSIPMPIELTPILDSINSIQKQIQELNEKIEKCKQNLTTTFTEHKDQSFEWKWAVEYLTCPGKSFSIDGVDSHWVINSFHATRNDAINYASHLKLPPWTAFWTPAHRIQITAIVPTGQYKNYLARYSGVHGKGLSMPYISKILMYRKYTSLNQKLK